MPVERTFHEPVRSLCAQVFLIDDVTKIGLKSLVSKLQRDACDEKCLTPLHPTVTSVGGGQHRTLHISPPLRATGGLSCPSHGFTGIPLLLDVSPPIYGLYPSFSDDE